jgi:hypothetical protein
LIVRCFPVIAVVLSFAVGAGRPRGATEVSRLEIPSGRPVTIDGVLSVGEWVDAVPVDITVSRDWVVRVLLKHDASNLYWRSPISNTPAPSATPR